MLEDPWATPQTPPSSLERPTLAAGAAILAGCTSDPALAPFLGSEEPAIPRAWDVAVPLPPVHTEGPDPDFDWGWEVKLKVCRGVAREALCLTLALDPSPFPPPIAFAGFEEAVVPTPFTPLTFAMSA